MFAMIFSLFTFKCKRDFFREEEKGGNEQMFERTVKPVLDVQDKPKATQWALLSLQHLFAMFGLQY